MALDTDFVKATLQSLQPHIDKINAHLDQGGKDAQHILNHVRAVNTNVALVQAHAAGEVEKTDVAHPDSSVVVLSQPDPKPAESKEDKPEAKPAPAPKPVVAPALTTQSASKPVWLKVAEYLAGAVLIAGAFVVAKHFGL